MSDLNGLNEAAAVEPVAPTENTGNGELENILKTYNRAVTNLGAVVILSFVNVILIATGAPVSFPFSAFFPSLITMIGKELVTRSELTFITVFCTALAVLSIVFYAGCWFMAKRLRIFILISLLAFILDSLLMLPFIPGGGASIWIDIIFHVWVLWSLFAGVKAWRKLKQFPAV